jgi:hypothetical protein
MKKLLYCLTFFTVSALSVFASDLFPFQTKGKYGFINQSGKVVVDPSFNFAEKFLFAHLIFFKRLFYTFCMMSF